MSVKECIREFEQLKIRNSLEEEPDQDIIRFLKGLDQSIAKKDNLQPYWGFEDVCKLAIKVEKYSKNKKPYTSSYSRPNDDLKPILPLNLKHKLRQICPKIRAREL